MLLERGGAFYAEVLHVMRYTTSTMGMMAGSKFTACSLNMADDKSLLGSSS